MGMKSLFQLAYTSKRSKHCTDVDLHLLLTCCRKNNKDLNISGILLYSEHKFIQYLEGNCVQILALYDKIKEDNRHKDLVMISFGPLDKRIFPNFSMRAFQLESLSITKTGISNAAEKAALQSFLEGEQQKDVDGVAVIQHLLT